MGKPDDVEGTRWLIGLGDGGSLERHHVMLDQVSGSTVRNALAVYTSRERAEWARREYVTVHGDEMRPSAVEVTRERFLGVIMFSPLIEKGHEVRHYCYDHDPRRLHEIADFLGRARIEGWRPE